MNKLGILLVDHGSKLDAANTMLIGIAEALQVKTPEAIVLGAHMELAAPDIQLGFQQLQAAGATSIRVIPFMLSPGRHSTKDIPALALSASQLCDNIPFSVATHMGEHPLIVDVLLQQTLL
jgi:sirohydrochlorin ferrochelatase